ncbi:MAG: hypothetical protein C6Y20_19185 [Tagaea sp. CACIAM 22H2]|nr:hypothetical protein [Tagaea sp. CACIAM 22H2]
MLDEQRRREYAIQLASLKKREKFEYEEVRSGRLAPIEPTIWSKADFIQKIQSIISSKDRKVPDKPDHIAASMLAIFTDDILTFGISEIETHEGFTSDKFDKVFLILGYDPSLAIKDIPEAPDGYPTIELKLSR